jgi:MFS transporter, PAT family, beta-lactamase induction signal transducer AmpG
MAGTGAAGGGAGKKQKTRVWAEIFGSRRMAINAVLGFASGLPLLLTGQALNLWLTDAHINIKTIALFASVGLPYTLKFAWAPLLDRYVPPFLGRRRGWMLISQIGLVAAIAAMAAMNPESGTTPIAVLAIVLAAFSATQDVVIDAWRADILTDDERAAGSAVYVAGYRAAMLVIGTAGIILAQYTSYQLLYICSAVLLAACIAATLMAEEPEQPKARPHSLEQAVILPFVDFFRRLGWAAIAALAFAAFYKFGDQMVDGLISTFWKRELKLSNLEIATFTKAAGFSGVAVGAFLAGVLTPRLGTKRALILFGLLQASTNILYAALALTGKSYILIGSSIFIDYVANMMGTAVFGAVFIAMCSKEVSATQYALLTSLSSVGKRVFGGVGGVLIANHGWAIFFWSTAAMAIPGLVLVLFLPRILLTPPHRPDEVKAAGSEAGTAAAAQGETR